MSQECQQPQAHPARCGCEQKEPYPDRLCHIDYTAHPYRCGCLKGDAEAQRRFDEYQRNASILPTGYCDPNRAQQGGEPMPPALPLTPTHGQLQSQQYVLRAMAHNYRNGHCWDHLDGEAVTKAADEITRLMAEIAALQQRLNVADQLVDYLKKDKERLDSLEANFWDVRHHSSALGDTGDYKSCVEIVGRWMDKPHERVIGENYDENLRAAIDQAMTADAYPPARPEYPELDTALSDEDWHINPCKQGHRDVGACGGKAFCHTCDETMAAATTQEAFEQWNATHPATPQ